MKSALQNIPQFRFRVMKVSFELWFESYLGNTEIWYKSVESNTGSRIFEQELDFFHSVGELRKKIFQEWILK